MIFWMGGPQLGEKEHLESFLLSCYNLYNLLKAL
jgi:hypothetical protein